MKDEIVLISGVSGQLGSAYARAFLQAGAQVAGGDIQYDAAIAKLEAEYPDRFQFVECDITSEESLKVMLREVEKRFAIPTVLINNAAIDSPPHAPAAENGIFEEYPRASWEKILEVNVTGTFLSCQIIGGAMAAAGRGSIVNISSIYGVVSPDQSLYQYRRDQGDIFLNLLDIRCRSQPFSI